MNEAFSYQFYATTKEAWAAMLEAITRAKKSIFWEIFIFVDDEIGKKFIDILEKKAREGVEIKMVIDGIGSYSFSKDAEKKLRESGIEVLIYNPVYPELSVRSWLRRIFNRNHRKVLIVDSETVFLGGVNVRDRFNTWDDLYLKIVGPVARPLLRGFAKSYLSAGGDKYRVRHLLHPKLRGLQEWKQKLRFLVHSPPYIRSTRIQRLYIRGLSMASETVNLITPYYVPSKEFLRSIALARKRGVKVNIFLPLRPDNKIAELLARTYYELTAKAGANLYFLPNMNHAKAMSVDQKMGSVGSMNITRRASHFDQEAGVVFTDTNMVQDLNKLFNMWKEGAQSFAGTSWAKRGLLERAQAWLVKKLEDFV